MQSKQIRALWKIGDAQRYSSFHARPPPAEIKRSQKEKRPQEKKKLPERRKLQEKKKLQERKELEKKKELPKKKEARREKKLIGRDGLGERLDAFFFFFPSSPSRTNK